jgi:hypothetical protein
MQSYKILPYPPNVALILCATTTSKPDSKGLLVLDLIMIIYQNLSHHVKILPANGTLLLPQLVKTLSGLEIAFV